MTQVLITAKANARGSLLASDNAIELKTGPDCRILLEGDEQVLLKTSVDTVGEYVRLSKSFTYHEERMDWELTITNRRIILFSPLVLKLTGGTKYKEGKATLGYYAYSDVYIANASIVDGRHRLLYYITPLSSGDKVEYPIYFEDSREKIDLINRCICKAWAARDIPVDSQSDEQIENFLVHCWDVIEQDGDGGTLAYGRRMENGREVRSFCFYNATIKDREREIVIDKIISLADQGAPGDKVLEYVSNTPFLLGNGGFSYLLDLINEYPDRQRQFLLAQALTKMGISLEADADGSAKVSISLGDGATLANQGSAPSAPLPVNNSRTMNQPKTNFCTSCGTRIKPESLFCGKCGQRLKQQ
ncbi:MAG: zinc ribbon domain-containing protein [Coriobacteriales bacterium]|jgi:hypothetical protein|nr:zinc ribbon domain-containing protein [Coriobacteriales bacterium]